MRTRPIAAVVAIALTLAAALPATAVHVRGSGRITAWGEGAIRVDGEGTFYARGAGTLTIRDLDHDADIEIHGFRYSRKTVDGQRVYRGSGWVRVSAPDAVLKLEGEIESFWAHGSGTLRLNGHGRFRVRGRTHRWPAVGNVIHFELAG